MNMKEYMIRRCLWNLACDYDEIERDSSFVVFSNDNPWANKDYMIYAPGADLLGFRFNQA